MDVKTFPFRLDKHTRALMTALIGALASHDARIQSLVRGECTILFKKKHDVPDINVVFLPSGIMFQYSLKTIAAKNPEVVKWLNSYHTFVSGQKKDTMKPVPQQCFVQVQAGYNGMLQYFLTYMVAYPDESIAQDTAQGALFASEGIGISMPANQQELVASDAGNAGGVW